MATLSPTVIPSGIRQRFALAIAAELADNGWTESRYPYDLFGLDPRDTAHLSYSVGLLDSRPLPGSRQRPLYVPTITRVGVRHGHRIRADAAVADYDAALTAEFGLMNAISKTPVGVATQGWSPRWVSTDRVIRGDGTLYVGTVIFELLHNYYWAEPD